MNYTMGRYIDEATDEMRDRLVTAEEFSEGAWWTGECGCLVGTAEDYGVRVNRVRHTEWHEKQWERVFGSAEYRPWRDGLAAFRYPRAVTRFGKARVVRAIKLRAAATTSRLEEARAIEVVR